MKTNKKIGLIPIVSLVFLLLFSGQPSVHADTTTSGGEQQGKRMRKILYIHQNKWHTYATDIHIFVGFNGTIKGWNVTISNFTSSTSSTPYASNLLIDANGAYIPWCNWVIVYMEVWVKPIGGKSLSYSRHVKWTKDLTQLLAVPKCSWVWEIEPYQRVYEGLVEINPYIINNDTTHYLNVTGLAFNVTANWYDDLTQIVFPLPHPNFTLAPGQSWSTNITISVPPYSGHIYSRYALTNSTGGIIAVVWEDWPFAVVPVGGIYIPVNKLELLAPYIGLTTLLIAAVISVGYVKKRKRKSEINS